MKRNAFMLEKRNIECILSLHVRKTSPGAIVPTRINLLLGFFFIFFYVDCLEVDSVFLYNSTDVREVAKKFSNEEERTIGSSEISTVICLKGSVLFF